MVTYIGTLGIKKIKIPGPGQYLYKTKRNNLVIVHYIGAVDGVTWKVRIDGGWETEIPGSSLYKLVIVTEAKQSLEVDPSSWGLVLHKVGKRIYFHKFSPQRVTKRDAYASITDK